jgi:hypothetical protein
MPQTATLGYHWYETPNIHLCTISDFVQMVRENSGRIEKAFALSGKGRTRPMQTDAWGPNIFAQGAIFVLTKS